MVDGLGKQIQAKDGSSQRIVTLDVKYAGSKVMVAQLGSALLVFSRVESVRDELIRLRVIKPADEDKKK